MVTKENLKKLYYIYIPIMDLELINAVKRNNIDNVEELLKKGANINTIAGTINTTECQIYDNDIKNVTPLLVALILHDNNDSQKNYSKMAKLLLNKGADPAIVLDDKPLHMNSSPLLWSIIKELPDVGELIVEKLLQTKTKQQIAAYLNLVETFDGENTNASCMDDIFSNGYYHLGAMLYNLGGRIHQKVTDSTHTPLHSAIEFRQKKEQNKHILSMIQMNHPDLHALDDEDYTPLARACERKYEDIAMALVENGSDIRRVADALGNDETTKIVCSKNVNNTFNSLWYNTDLKKAIYDDDYQRFEEIINGEHILSAINNAYLLNREKMIKYFEAYPELFNLRTLDRKTIWHIATKSGNTRLIKRLPELVKREKASSVISRFLRKKSKKAMKKSSKNGGTRRCHSSKC